MQENLELKSKLDEIRFEVATLQLQALKRPDVEQRGIIPLLGSPIGLAIAGAISTAILAILSHFLQGLQAEKTQRLEFESTLIVRAMEESDESARGNALRFLLDTGLVTETKAKLEKQIEVSVPSLTPVIISGSREPDPLTPPLVIPNRINLISNDLNPSEFIETNAEAISQIVEAVNQHIAASYDNAIPVSLEDALCSIYMAMGLSSSGMLDPDHTHSEGERGLLPLPANIKFWLGNDAPRWDKAMPLRVNIESWVLYLGILKNRQVVTREGSKYKTLYRDLFVGKELTEAVNARILYATLLGYFNSGAYRNSNPEELDQVADRLREGGTLASCVEATSYFHSRSGLVVAWEKKFMEALRIAQNAKEKD